VKVLSAAGARPQFVKLTPIGAAPGITRRGCVIVHTHRHYDAPMPDVEKDLKQ
jgi:UDP-N-acetylglucosamine 2-epimerase